MRQKSEQGFFSLRLVDCGGAHFVDQAAFAVGAFVPGVHGVKLCIGLVDNKHRALGA